MIVFPKTSKPRLTGNVPGDGDGKISQMQFLLGSALACAHLTTVRRNRGFHS
jgi:hypothetical protein